MAFLALAGQKSLMTLQKNFLQFQYTQIMNQTQAATAQMTAIERQYAANDDGSGSGSDYTENATYIYYQDLSDQLETEKDSLDSQLTAIESEISSLKTLVQNNIKSSCTLNLINS